jgi:cold shock CspA family protein
MDFSLQFLKAKVELKQLQKLKESLNTEVEEVKVEEEIKEKTDNNSEPQEELVFQKGKVTKVFSEKGYGFISSGGKDFFFLLRDFSSAITLQPGYEVEFVLTQSSKGEAATNLRISNFTSLSDVSVERYLEDRQVTGFFPHSNCD